MMKENTKKGIFQYLQDQWDEENARKFAEQATKPTESYEKIMLQCPCCGTWYFPFKNEQQFVDPEYAEKIQEIIAKATYKKET